MQTYTAVDHLVLQSVPVLVMACLGLNSPRVNLKNRDVLPTKSPPDYDRKDEFK